MNKATFSFLLALCLLFHPALVQARQPYHATVTVDGVSETVTAPNLVDLNRDLRTRSIELLFAIYTPVSPVSIDFNIRGIQALAAFPGNSSSLVVAIPQTNRVEIFNGATRDDSLTLFKDYIRDGGHHHRLLKAYAKYSPIDPIAGNPNSLQSQMAQADYLLGRLSPLSGCDCCWSAQPIVHQYQTGLYTGRAFSKGFETTIVTMPLRYSYSPNLNWAFIIDAPLSYFRNDGASSVFGSVGVGVRLPITFKWSVTPTIRFGSGGSLDLCTAGTFASAAISSVYNCKIDDFVISMTNYAGYFTSVNFWLTGINYNYHLHNYILKNGLTLASCKGFNFCGKPLNFNLSFIDSYFAKDRLFIRHYDEVGFSLIINKGLPCINYDCLSLGFAYQFGQKKYKGYFFDLTYQF